MRIVLLNFSVFFLLLTCVFADDSSEYTVEIIHPSDGEFIDQESFFIIVSVQPSVPDINTDTGLNRRLFLEIDGESADDKMETDQPLIRYMLDNKKDISGKHSAKFALTDSSGDTLVKKEWQFTVLSSENVKGSEEEGSEIDNKNVQGRVYSQASHYFYDRRGKIELYQGADIAGHIDKIRYGSRILINNLNHSNTQDRNRYYAWVNYGRNFRLKAGDTHPDYHPTLFRGTRIRGFEAGGSVITEDGSNPVNLDIAFGQARRAAEPDTYKRNITASRLSFGSGKKFQLGLCLLKGRDDTSSVDHKTDTLADGSMGADSVYYVNRAEAADNLAFGADFTARLFKDRLSFSGDYAFSLYTRNINNGPLTNEEVEEAFGNLPVNFEAFSKLFVYNLSSSPLHPSLDGLINSSAMNLAVKVNLPFQKVKEKFKIRYTLQGANFYSMGNTFSGFPKKGFEITEEMRLFSNRVAINTSYSRYSDDLDRSREYPTLINKFTLSTSMVNISNLPSLTLNYNYDGSVNRDTLYGFKNGMNMINAVCDVDYDLDRFSGIVRFYTGWSGINNQWNNVDFNESSSFSAQKTDMSFNTGVYGINLNARFEETPLSFGTGFSTNAGSDKLIRLYSGNGFFRYQIIKKVLFVNSGLYIGSVQMPGENRFKFYFRLPYGVTFTQSKGHSLLLDGYTIERSGEWDLVNTLRYEWRF